MLRRSMSGNTGLNTLAQTSGGMIRRNDSSGKLYMNPNGNSNGPSNGSSTDGSKAAYRANLVSHFAEDLDRRRRIEKHIEERTEMPSDNLKIECVELYARDNAREHRTDRYEMVRYDAERERHMNLDNLNMRRDGLSPSLSMTNMALTPISSSMNAMSSMHPTMMTMDHAFGYQQRTYQTAVLRRGQPFFIAVRMKDRNFDPRRDILRVCFNFGPTPQVTKGTRVVLPFRQNQREFTRAPQKWDLRLHQQEGFNMTFQVHIPANALVGLWRVNIETTTMTPGARVDDFRFKDDIYILFNPYIRDDPVYLDSEDLRREYVMNETGKVYVGTHNRPKGRRWVYGQFSDVALPVAQLLLEQSGLNPTERGNPVKVVRAISAIINANEGFGLLEGKWEGTFEDGVCPWAWTGSNRIFEHYLRNGSKPVKYGQCWVFAAVATSLFRALGIPSRPVTNFISARDTNHTLSVDKYFDIFGEEMKGGPDGDNQDAIWNFHSWTETWMSRQDLPHGFGGWQAVDPTPAPYHNQKNCSEKMQRGPTSMEGHRHGPSSVEAVRRGEIGFAFDSYYLFTEVNAEVSHFQEDETSHWGFKKCRLNNYQVGRQILTKRAGQDDDVADADMEDITSLYKQHVEGQRHGPHGPHRRNKFGDMDKFCDSTMDKFGMEKYDKFGKPKEFDESTGCFSSMFSTAAERMMIMNSSRGVDKNQPMFEFAAKCNEDVYFDLIEQDKIIFGQPFNVTFQMQNRSSEMRTITAVLSANSAYYTGVVARRLMRADRQFVLQPGARETMQVRVSWEDYRDKMVDFGHIKIYAMANVQETKQAWSEEDDFQLEKPKLDVQIRGQSCQAGQDCFVTFSFMNPVSTCLTECEFIFEGPGLVRPQTVKYRDVKPGEMISFVQKFTPRFSGERKLVATFNSRELGDIMGSRPIHVRD